MSKRRNLIVPNAGEAERMISKAVEELVRLNEGHAYTFDRDALIRRLDTARLKARPRLQR